LIKELEAKPKKKKPAKAENMITTILNLTFVFINLDIGYSFSINYGLANLNDFDRL